MDYEQSKQHMTKGGFVRRSSWQKKRYIFSEPNGKMVDISGSSRSAYKPTLADQNAEDWSIMKWEHNQ